MQRRYRSLILVAALSLALGGCATPVLVAGFSLAGALVGPVIGIDEMLLQAWAKSKGYCLTNATTGVNTCAPTSAPVSPPAPSSSHS